MLIRKQASTWFLEFGLTKIIGIGLNKTGTSTLGAAGELLGLRVKTWDAQLFRETVIERRRETLWKVIDAFDLFNDFPYPLLYPEIDARYPGSKFILTQRTSPDAWLGSVKAHAMRASPSSQTHRLVYGYQYPHGRESAFLEYYTQHNERARRYFADRQDDFLEICWEEESDWSRLTAFLGAEPPDAPLPRANARVSKLVNPLRYAWNVGARFAQNFSAR